MSQKLVKILSSKNDDWHIAEDETTFCNGESFADKETDIKYIARGGVNCLNCIERVLKIKKIKL
jgi:hypothetical protein